MLNRISVTAPDLVALPQLISIVGAAPDGFDHKRSCRQVYPK